MISLQLKTRKSRIETEKMTAIQYKWFCSAYEILNDNEAKKIFRSLQERKIQSKCHKYVFFQ